MKKLLLAVLIAAFGAAACSSGNANTKSNTTASARNGASSKEAKYQIIDQEFDNLLAPDTDYDTLPAYELQACGDSYLPPATALKGANKPAVKKPAKKAAAKTTVKKSSKNVSTSKKVINNTNIYYLDGSAPNTSTSSTTTTTYVSKEVAPDADLPDTL